MKKKCNGKNEHFVSSILLYNSVYVECIAREMHGFLALIISYSYSVGTLSSPCIKRGIR